MSRRVLEWPCGARATSEGIAFVGGESKSSCAMADKMGSKYLRSIFDPLKPNLTKATAVLLEDIFKSILEDLGFPASSSPIMTKCLLESISESLLGKQPAGPPESGSVSRIASFVASDIVDNVLNKLHSTTQTMCSDLLPKNYFVAGCKEMGQVGPGKPAVPNLASWTAQTPPSSHLVNGVAEEMVQMITSKLELFAVLSQIKLIQCKLSAEMKAVGVPREQLFAGRPPRSSQAEATEKGDACKPKPKIYSSSDKRILQCVEDVINSVLSYILKQTSQKGLLPPRESSVLLHLVNDVFQSFRALKNSLPGVFFENFSPPVQSRVGLKMQGGLPDYDTQPPTITTEKEMRKTPCPPIINCPGMAIFEEQDEEKTQPSRTFSPVTREQRVLVMEETQGKAKYESLDGESPHRRKASPESFPWGGERFLETGEKAELESLEKTESALENLVQDAIFTFLESEQTAAFPRGQIPDIGQPTKATSCIMYQALKKMEDHFMEEEEELPLVVETLQKLFNEIFQHLWGDQLTWLPAPPSFAHLTINRHQQEKQEASKEYTQFNSQSPISKTEVNTFAGRLVKTIFQKLSHVVLAEADSSRSKHSSLIITSAFPLDVAAGTKTDLAAAHFQDSAMSLERGTSEGGPWPPVEDVNKGNQPKIHSLQPKTNLACDLVEVCLAKVQDFVATKAEPQFCSHMQNLNMVTISEVASTVDQVAKKVSATATVSQKRSSRFEKVFKALSRVFSRTSPRKRDKPATDRQKPPTD